MNGYEYVGLWIAVYAICMYFGWRLDRRKKP